MRMLSIYLLVAIVFMGAAGICHAAAIGPMEPLGPMKVSMGPEYNGMYGRDLDNSGAINSGEVRASNQVYMDIVLGLTDWANVYTKLGAANLQDKLNWSNGRNQTIKYDYGFLWGLGGNCLFDIGNDFGVGADAQINTWACDADSISGQGSPVFTEKGSARAYEFQAAAYFTYSYDVGADSKIIPYLGGYYSYFKINNNKTNKYEDDTYTYVEDGNITGKDNFGLLAGLDVKYYENVYVKLQGRFLAETAASVGISYKY